MTVMRCQGRSAFHGLKMI